MFDFIEEKLKIAGRLIFLVGSIVVGIFSLLLFAAGVTSGEGFLFLFPFLCLGGGMLSTWIFSIVLYGLGESIDCTKQVLKKMDIENRIQNKSEYEKALQKQSVEDENGNSAITAKSEHIWRCKHCNKLISAYPCEYCGKGEE